MSAQAQFGPYLYGDNQGVSEFIGAAINLYAPNTAESSFHLQWDTTWPATVIVEVSNDPLVQTNAAGAKWTDVTDRFTFVQPVDAPVGAGNTLIAGDGLCVGWWRLRITTADGEIAWFIWTVRVPKI